MKSSRWKNPAPDPAPVTPVPSKTVHFSDEEEEEVERDVDEQEEEEEEVNNEEESEEDEAEDEDEEPSCRTPKTFHKSSMQVTDNLSRQDILKWINSLMESKLTKIEELGTGVVYCLLMNRLYSGSIDLNKIKYHPKLQPEYIRNFTILQASFKMMLLDKVVPIHKLAKCQFPDNFEFVQWFKRFYEANYIGQPSYGLDLLELE